MLLNKKYFSLEPGIFQLYALNLVWQLSSSPPLFSAPRWPVRVLPPAVPEHLQARRGERGPAVPRGVEARGRGQGQEARSHRHTHKDEGERRELFPSYMLMLVWRPNFFKEPPPMLLCV